MKKVMGNKILMINFDIIYYNKMKTILLKKKIQI